MLKEVNVFRCDSIGTARSALELVKTGDVLQFNIGGALVNFQVIERESMLLYHLDESREVESAMPEPLAPLADLDVVGKVVHIPEPIPAVDMILDGTAPATFPPVEPPKKKSVLDFFRR